MWKKFRFSSTIKCVRKKGMYGADWVRRKERIPSIYDDWTAKLNLWNSTGSAQFGEKIFNLKALSSARTVLRIPK